MFVFSEMHPWQGNAAVQQVLVFSNEEVKAKFEAGYQEVIGKHTHEDASDSNLGAIYKLRAVKLSSGEYAPVIRCGFTGKVIWDDNNEAIVYTTPGQAIVACAAKLSGSIVPALFTLQRSLQSIA